MVNPVMYMCISFSFSHAFIVLVVRSCILFVPVDVVKERMQIQSQASATTPGAVFYKNSIDAVKTIARVEGFRGIYRGYAATLLSFGPFSALYFTFYEEVS